MTEREILFIRMPKVLKEWLRHKAKQERRSMSEQAVYILDKERQTEEAK